ncbi:hypothetical protein ACIBI8_23400 [Streptomyces sp. NPDC050529]|uniref:hypothetical protein n=1 Tax=Streptomyces sp. NPDC050529 TaxID=3365624 RepID=UPI00379CA6FA
MGTGLGWGVLDQHYGEPIPGLQGEWLVEFTSGTHVKRSATPLVGLLQHPEQDGVDRIGLNGWNDTIGMLTVHAWLALSDPTTTRSAETLTLLLETAERRIAADAAPHADTTRVIRNAHTLWHHLRADDPETALDLAPRLLDLLQDHPRRTGDVIEWAAGRRIV